MPDGDGIAAGPSLSRRHAVGAGSARSLLLTVLGEFVLPDAGRVWTSTMVDVLGRAGVEEKATRQALARTAADGWIVSTRDGRRTRWDLTSAGRRLLTEGAERIYSFLGDEPPWDGRWLVLIVSVPESRRELRHRIRTRLTWAGFGSPVPGVWISANTAREAEAKQILADLGLTGGVFSFRGPFAGLGSAMDLVAQAWDLDDVAEHYRRFVAEFGVVRPESSDESLIMQIRLVHEWRRMPFMDPQLPSELLPRDWVGRTAVALFRSCHAAWGEPSRVAWIRAHPLLSEGRTRQP